jgi:hypothetical protein
MYVLIDLFVLLPFWIFPKMAGKSGGKSETSRTLIPNGNASPNILAIITFSLRDHIIL